MPAGAAGLGSGGGGAVGSATEKGLDAVTAGAAMKGFAIAAPAKSPPGAEGVKTEGDAPFERGSAGGGASGVIAMVKGEGWKRVVGSVAPMAGGSGTAEASPNGEEVVVPAWEAGTKGLTPKGDGGRLSTPGAPALLGSAALGGSNWASLWVGSGTSLASCGLTGVWNIAGHARYTSKSGRTGRPLRRAFSSTASGMRTGWAGDTPGFFAISGGSEESRSPIVSPGVGSAGDENGLIGAAETGWPRVSGAAVLKRRLPENGVLPAGAPGAGPTAVKGEPP